MDEQAGGQRTGYHEVAASLRSRIVGEALPAGRLPAEDVLATEFGVARDTVRRALAVLVEEGLIRSTHGRGHFVLKNDPSVGSPKYLIVVDSLRRSITSGKLRPGDALPTQAALQADFGVSRTTARRALLELDETGLVAQLGGRRVVR